MPKVALNIEDKGTAATENFVDTLTKILEENQDYNHTNRQIKVISRFNSKLI